jgi:B12-binding domain/radical SAM domain protein
MPSVRILFVEERYNKHSVAALAGALEALEDEGWLAVGFLKTATLPWALLPLAHRPERLVLAYSFHTLNVPAVARQVEIIRQFAQRHGVEFTLLAGGPHASGDPAGTLRLGFDAALRGEGEAGLTAFLRAVDEGRSWGDVPGLVSGESPAEGLADSADTSRLSSPVDLDEFAPFAARHRRFAPIEISRGCPWACRFCQTTFFLGGRMRHRSVAAVLHHAGVMRSLGPRELRFVSPNAFAYGSVDGRSPNPGWVERLLREAVRIFGREHVYFGSFPSEVRPETVTPELVGLVRRLARNTNIVIGSQSGSDRLLAEIHRGHTVADVVRSVEVIVAGGLLPIVDFILGLPGEIPQDRRDTLDLMERLVGLGAQVHGHAFMPLPGTPFGGALPASIDEETRQFMLRLDGTGRQIGKWREQAERARDVARFLEEN